MFSTIYFKSFFGIIWNGVSQCGVGNVNGSEKVA